MLGAHNASPSIGQTCIRWSIKSGLVHDHVLSCLCLTSLHLTYTIGVTSVRFYPMSLNLSLGVLKLNYLRYTLLSHHMGPSLGLEATGVCPVNYLKQSLVPQEYNNSLHNTFSLQTT